MNQVFNLMLTVFPNTKISKGFDVIQTGNKLICIDGNEFYKKGKFYTVGEFINDRYFELLLDDNSECWYGTIDDKGIYVHFNTTIGDYSNAWFDTV